MEDENEYLVELELRLLYAANQVQQGKFATLHEYLVKEADDACARRLMLEAVS